MAGATTASCCGRWRPACGAALSNSLLLLLIFWEALTAILFLFVNTGLKERAASDGAAKSFIMLGLSDAALFLAVALIWVQFRHAVDGANSRSSSVTERRPPSTSS